MAERKIPAYALFALIIVGAAALAFVVLGSQEPVACTMEAKLCPDGSYVGRIPPKCEFAPCPGNYSWIKNFDDCARAGFPIMESYPRQCRTPDGRTFVEQGVSQICRYPGDCEAGFFCKYGACTEMNINSSCSDDSDCVLINNELGFSCCWAGACEERDYSLDKWVAANRNWFEEGREKYCPSIEECGPAPGCATRLLNDSFEAKCEIYRCGPAERCIGANKCAKVPKQI